VHPTKQEIKFEDDRIIYTFIQAAIRHALAQYSVTPTLDFDQDPTFANLPAYYKKQTQTQLRDKFQNGSFKTVESRINELPAVIENKNTNPSDVNIDWNRYKTSPIIQPPIEGKLSNTNVWYDYEEKEAPAFQLHNQYILTPIKSGFIVIDQQAAHERVLYEKYLAQLHGKKHHSQQQLFPQTLNLSSSDAAILSEIVSDINNLGFDVQPFGKDTFVIHGIPAEFENMHQQKVIEDIIEQFKEDKAQLKINKHDLIAKSLAKSNAIKAGQKLTEKEMLHLIDELFACSIPYASPAGTHTFVTFGLHDLEKHFNKSY
jgi:DNA mismatch repair protein MutL